MVSDMLDDQTIRDETELRGRFGPVVPVAALKVLDHLDEYALRFIALSPLLVLASAEAGGGTDASPRGDAPGFVAAPDPRTLVIPDRRGNNRLDSFANILTNPQVGLLFFVPGIDETLRVKGAGEITRDPAVLEPLAAQGKVPAVGLVVRVREVMFHCGKALIRSRLWNPEGHIPRGAFPSLGRIIADQTAAVTAEDAEANLAEAYRTRLY
ncbi:pyridoxamine 5'-phosphate oxidase family protein [Methylobacterium sp. J-076]|uniref:pyridoxamine 5'-phosphate oxidase family protein n=1 Tax=Methylobacterium sp. J-076 TaxID=2836655 RepID=UPI001FB8A1F7|nr:pyridoxamine 5'-phosphate oxidase family protein [Methylobacterium sp. J-076]MCJ2012710.1 pyridoxamine 5'-phosphate oxidase family protein [Methylobacterium sp. J-076]